MLFLFPHKLSYLNDYVLACLLWNELIRKDRLVERREKENGRSIENSEEKKINHKGNKLIEHAILERKHEIAIAEGSL